MIVKLKQILKEIPTDLFDFLAKDLNSDYKVKKLTSRTVFMVILHSMFSEKNFSLRKLKKNFDNKTFQKKILGKENVTSIDHSSFHYRLNTINFKYFERIYKYLTKKSMGILGASNFLKNDVIRFDSTLVSISSKIAKNIGFNQSGDQVKSKKVKFTVGYGELPETVKIFETIKHKSENVALKEAIKSKSIPKHRIILFDRGLSNRSVFDELSETNYFISRLNPGYKMEIETEKELNEETETLFLIKEKTGKLYDVEQEKSKNNYRVIHTKLKEVLWDKKKETSLRQKMKSKKHAGKTKEEVKKEMLEEEIVFVTNIDKKVLGGEEIALLYKKRWDIEVLFKFLKQELHFSHLINNSLNGIKVMVYMTLIFSLLLLIYKKKNNLSGYKYVKYQMLQELQEEFFKFVVVLSGGSLQKWENSTATFW